jgi:hypothetical protein
MINRDAPEEIVTLLSSAKCLEMAERKLGEAAGDRRHGKELRATAEAWLVLAQKIAQAEAIEARVMQLAAIENCGEHQVYGAEELMFMGKFIP